MSHNPADNCFNSLAIQYRTGTASDEFGGTVNVNPVRIKAGLEPLAGFSCGVFAREPGDTDSAGGQDNVDYWTIYCDVRDMRKQDYIVTTVYPGRKIIIGNVKRVGGVGQITPFMKCTGQSLRNDSRLTTSPPPLPEKT